MIKVCRVLGCHLPPVHVQWASDKRDSWDIVCYGGKGGKTKKERKGLNGMRRSGTKVLISCVYVMQRGFCWGNTVVDGSGNVTTRGEGLQRKGGLVC